MLSRLNKPHRKKINCGFSPAPKGLSLKFFKYWLSFFGTYPIRDFTDAYSIGTQRTSKKRRHSVQNAAALSMTSINGFRLEFFMTKGAWFANYRKFIFITTINSSFIFNSLILVSIDNGLDNENRTPFFNF